MLPALHLQIHFLQGANIVDTNHTPIASVRPPIAMGFAQDGLGWSILLRKFWRISPIAPGVIERNKSSRGVIERDISTDKKQVLGNSRF
jgi:hypothetical protein